MSAGRTSRRFRRLEEASSQHQADEASPVSETAIPIAGGSWRMVEGENSSFDTTILPSPMVDNAYGGSRIPVLSGRPSSGPPSQVSSQVSSQVPSQGGHMSASQDSLSDFVKHQDDDRIILRELFRPSVVSPVEPEQDWTQRTPDPQFKMPLMQVDAGRGSDSKSKSIRRMSSENPQEGEGGYLVRRRGQINTGSPSSRKSRPKKTSFHDEHLNPTTQSEQDGPRGSSNIAALLPSAMFKILVWAGEIILIALHFAKYPLGMLLAAYLVFGGAIIVQNMATRSVYSALSPVCRLPGLSLLNLPFCPPKNTVLFGDSSPSTGGQGHGRSVEFEDLMGVQAKFEQVLEHSAEGVSLPLEMKRSELAVRDLRSLVRHSDVQARHELVLEFDGYIDIARRSSSELQKFNSHVGSAVDAVISINRWTSRYIDSLSPDSALGAGAAGSSVLMEWTQWIFSPFQPADQHMFSERIIMEKYIEHTSLVSQRISSLILEAQAVLRLLTKAEDHLGLIYDITSRTSASVSSRREEILWSIWTLVGANSGRLQSLSQQLTLLQQVDAQRSTAVKQVSALILELESIQAGLGDLRDRVAEPQFSGASSAAYIPLSVHIETIDRGVDRLQAARRRIRAAEDGRVRDTMAGLRDGPSELIDAGKR
ncbi:hypothetical protein E4U59_007443 [Claviceps monticola]|nr:hypothetical protein E4U59_007443 [Claviceps monticola]